MEWTETQEIAAERARILNRLEFGLFHAALYIGGFSLISAFVVFIVTFFAHKHISWDALPIFVTLGPIPGLLVCLLKLLPRWNRAKRCRYSIHLDDGNIVATCNGFRTNYTYGDFSGFSIFEASDGSLGTACLIFIGSNGGHASIGIPPDISLSDIRSFLAGKLREMTNDEVPEPQNPYLS